jgi:hypothetical protein
MSNKPLSRIIMIVVVALLAAVIGILAGNWAVRLVFGHYLAVESSVSLFLMTFFNILVAGLIMYRSKRK